MTKVRRNCKALPRKLLRMLWWTVKLVTAGAAPTVQHHSGKSGNGRTGPFRDGSNSERVGPFPPNNMFSTRKDRKILARLVRYCYCFMKEKIGIRKTPCMPLKKLFVTCVPFKVEYVYMQLTQTFVTLVPFRLQFVKFSPLEALTCGTGHVKCPDMSGL
jgi:hypothetical protein